MNADGLRVRVAEVRERIKAARARSGGSDEVTLVAVTKDASGGGGPRGDRGRRAENRVQEMDDKVAEIPRAALAGS